MAKKVKIFDTTLRDGEQTPGVALNPEKKLTIAKALSELGVDIIEAGFPINSESEFDAVKTIAEEVDTDVCALARALPADVDSAAKAGVSNFTKWLAVHMAQEYSPEIRVNAIAPGFFLTEQNRFLLTEEATGELTARGKTIIEHTPAGKFGSPEDLVGAVLWLLSPASSFVTGIILPIDGGFEAFSGV